MRTREEQIKPWGYISPFATETLRDRAKCDLTITKKATHNITMPLYTEEHILEAERRAEQRVRAEIARDSERLDWIGTQDVVIGQGNGTDWKEVLLARYQRTLPSDLVDIRETIDAAREVG